MKKNTRVIWISLAVVALVSICMLIVWNTLKSNTEDARPDALDVTKLYKVNIYGTEGEGYVDLVLDEGYYEAYIIESGVPLEQSDVAVDIDKPNNLSNGDEFIIAFKDIEALQAKGAKVSRSSASYTVEGLKIGTDFDVFADLVVYVHDGNVIFDDSECSNFIKDNVEFFIKGQQSTYKDGDTINVGAYVDMNVATDNGYKIEKTETIIIITEQERTND